MQRSRFNVRRTVPLVMAALLLAGSLLWVWHVVGMQENGTMESCLLTGGRVMLCALSAAEQIGLWQQTFPAILPFAGTLLALVVVLLAVGRMVHPRLLPGRNLSPIHPWFLRRSRYWLPREPLREAFSQGILHPKIYG